MTFVIWEPKIKKSLAHVFNFFGVINQGFRSKSKQVYSGKKVGKNNDGVFFIIFFCFCFCFCFCYFYWLEM